MDVDIFLRRTCSSLFDAAGGCRGVGPDAQSFIEFCLCSRFYPYVLHIDHSPVHPVGFRPRLGQCLSGPYEMVSPALDFNFATK